MKQWKAEARGRLRQYEAMCRAEKNLMAPGQDPKQLRLTRLWLRQTRHALEVLTPEERMVLGQFYVCPGKGHVERLCQILDRSPSTVYRWKDRALGRFAQALFGRPE